MLRQVGGGTLSELDKQIKMIDEKICFSTAALSQLFNLDPRTIQAWGTKGCPKADRGWWALRDVMEWKGYIGANGAHDPKKVDEMKLYEQKLHFDTQLKKAQMEALQLKNDINLGVYLLRSEAAEDVSRFLGVLKRSLTGLSRKISIEIGNYVDPLTARKVEHLLGEEITNALEQMSVDGVYDSKAKKKKSKT